MLAPDIAFPLVKKLLALNDAETGKARVEVILLSRNSADTGLRVFNSIRHHGLDITRAAFTHGESAWRYIAPFGAHLFLSASQDDVRKALEAGCAAAHPAVQMWAGASPASCVSPLTAMPLCSPTSQSRSASAKAWRLSGRTNGMSSHPPGDDVNASDDKGRSALILAASRGHT